jgi:hypothetical protein
VELMAGLRRWRLYGRGLSVRPLPPGVKRNGLDRPVSPEMRGPSGPAACPRVSGQHPELSVPTLGRCNRSEVRTATESALSAACSLGIPYWPGKKQMPGW